MSDTYPTEEGSLAGIALIIGRTSITAGKHIIVAETPGDDAPALLTAGTRPTGFRVSASIAGSRWRSDAELLLEAVVDGQTVGFQHPTWGSYRVKVRNGIEIQQSIARASGRTEMELDLVVDPGQQSFVYVSDDPGSAINQGVASVESLATVQAGNVSPGFASTIASTFSDLASGVSKANARVTASVIGAASIQDSIDRFQTGVAQLAGSPGALFSAYVGILRQLYQGIAAVAVGSDQTFDPRAKAAVQSTRDMLDGSADIVAEPPVETEAQAARREAATDLAAAAHAVAQVFLYEILATIDPPDATSAQDTIDEIDEMSTALYDLILDGDLYDAHQATRALIVQRLVNLTRDLPQIEEYKPPTPTSALLVAFGLYGSTAAVGRDLEIERRNPLTNPARIPETQTLDVVLDAV